MSRGRAFALLIVALGGFSLAAQSLLFRSWLHVLEGSELAIGSFFAGWLLWVGLGALLARRAGRRLPAHGVVLAWLALAYLPAYLLQELLITGAPVALGLAAWEVVPLGALVRTALLVNAPVSFVTGFLFTFACRVAATQGAGSRLAVARVWVLECAGGCAGGLGVTGLLAVGAEEPTVISLAGCLVAAASAVLVLATPRARTVLAVPAAAVAAVLLGGVVFGVDHTVQQARDLARWERLLRAETWRGAFATPQARYLHGEREGQFLLVAWGEVVETLPPDEAAAEIVAHHLVQHPEAERVAVVGPGAAAVAARFAVVPGVAHVVWLPPDPALPEALRSVGPAAGGPGIERVTAPGTDARTYMRENPARFDLVLLHLPDLTTLHVSRYATAEFLDVARRALRPGGVLSLRVTGGENVLGDERAWIGASAWRTLGATFPRLAVKPGEETWLFGSVEAHVTSDAKVVTSRALRNARIAAIFPPEALADAFPADRVAFQTERYESLFARLGDDVLLNTDREPRALLSHLALSLRRSGHDRVADRLVTWVRITGALVAAGLALLGLLRVAWEMRLGRGRPRARGPRGETRTVDAFVLAFTTGLAGMALGVVLMNLYQARFGSLHLEVGLVSALFMGGLVAGGNAMTRRLLRAPEGPWLLPAALLLLAILAAGAILALPTMPQGLAMLAFLAVGLATGLAFPLAAHRMERAGVSAGRAATLLESADHLGGAVGAAVAGLLLLPLVGTATTLGLLVLLVALNLAPLLVPRRDRGTRPIGNAADARLRTAGFVLLGVTAWVLLGAHLVARAEAGDRVRSFERAARALAGRTDLVFKERHLPAGDRTTVFGVVPGEDEAPASFVLDSRSLATDDQGYGGPVELAIHLTADGVLLDWRVVASHETPAYLAMIDVHRDRLLGRNSFTEDAFEGVDAVTGATVTWDAIQRILEQSARRFGREVLGRSDIAAMAPRPAAGPDRDFLVLLVLTLLALVLRRRPVAWLRRAYLLLVLLVAGYALNLQYASVQVGALLRLEVPALAFTAAFFLVVLVPVLVFLFGNVYCGYLCPFGAAQELLGDLGRRRRLDPSPDVWRWGRAVKYVLLALLLVLVSWTGRRDAFEVDPLVTFFSRSPYAPAYLLALFSLALSLPFGRFWCRNLCPAGAFLSLLNRVRLLRRILPAPRPGRCDLGIRHHWELDCICCDRCHHEPRIEIAAREPTESAPTS